MLRVPGSKKDLFHVKAEGGDIRIVYSPMEALKIARMNPQKKVVFFGIGFETTAPAHAMAILTAHREGLTNFYMLASHVLVPPAIRTLLDSPHNCVQAFIAPGHVCAVVGFDQYFSLARDYRVPIVVAGFEPLDLLEAIHMLIAQLEAGKHEVQNQYARSVTRYGNLPAQRAVEEVFEVCDRKWRGIGCIPLSGMRINSKYAAYDAERVFGLEDERCRRAQGMHRAQVLMGLKKPLDCPEFGARCKPELPLGAPMVSPEGACSAYYQYRASPRARRAPNGHSLMPNKPQFDGVLACPAPLPATERVLLGHGSGGKLSAQLVERIFLPAFGNPTLDQLNDQATSPSTAFGSR